MPGVALEGRGSSTTRRRGLWLAEAAVGSGVAERWWPSPEVDPASAGGWAPDWAGERRASWRRFRLQIWCSRSPPFPVRVTLAR